MLRPSVIVMANNSEVISFDCDPLQIWRVYVRRSWENQTSKAGQADIMKQPRRIENGSVTDNAVTGAVALESYSTQALI